MINLFHISRNPLGKNNVWDGHPGTLFRYMIPVERKHRLITSETRNNEDCGVFLPCTTYNYVRTRTYLLLIFRLQHPPTWPLLYVPTFTTPKRIVIGSNPWNVIFLQWNLTFIYSIIFILSDHRVNFQYKFHEKILVKLDSFRNWVKRLIN